MSSAIICCSVLLRFPQFLFIRRQRKDHHIILKFPNRVPVRYVLLYRYMPRLD